MKADVITQPARGPSIAELHGYFAREREAADAVRGGYDRDQRAALHGKCALFAGRLVRAPAGGVSEIVLKLQAVDFLEMDPREALAIIRADLSRLDQATPAGSKT
jgi:hypothetical protein